MNQTRFQQFSSDHRALLELAARQAGIVDPVVINLGEFYEPLLMKSKRRDIMPLDGVLVRDWDPSSRREYDGIHVGMRVYEIEGVRYVRVLFGYNTQQNNWAFVFTAVGRADYRKFYRLALRCRRDAEPLSQPPVLPSSQRDILWKNTIGYLEGPNLRRIKAYGGRARRGILLMGPPGNGKTSACRWIWQECRRRLWDWRLVTPDAYRHARSSDSIEQLFSVERRGIVFFDDMDLALRDRETVHESEDQAVFLSALDGIEVNEGVVFVFTTNCALELIDRAFKRPGRIDLVLEFNPPDARLRQELIERWHPDILASLEIETAVESTEGFSFAELDEMKNLLIMHFMDSGEWNWNAARQQLDINRKELSEPRKKRHVGFGHTLTESNGGTPF